LWSEATTLSPSLIVRRKTMPIPTKLHAVRVNLADRRTERTARRRLSAELAAFRTPAERAELDLILGRHTHEETREIRDILNRQDYERQRAGNALGGHRG
jgi:protease II